MSRMRHVGASADHGAVGARQSGGPHQVGKAAVPETGQHVASVLLGVGLRVIGVPGENLALVDGVGGATFVGGLAAVGRVTAFGSSRGKGVKSLLVEVGEAFGLALLPAVGAVVASGYGGASAEHAVHRRAGRR